MSAKLFSLWEGIARTPHALLKFWCVAATHHRLETQTMQTACRTSPFIRSTALLQRVGAAIHGAVSPAVLRDAKSRNPAQEHAVTGGGAAPALART